MKKKNTKSILQKVSIEDSNKLTTYSMHPNASSEPAQAVSKLTLKLKTGQKKSENVHPYEKEPSKNLKSQGINNTKRKMKNVRNRRKKQTKKETNLPKVIPPRVESQMTGKLSARKKYKQKTESIDRSRKYKNTTSSVRRKIKSFQFLNSKIPLLVPDMTERHAAARTIQKWFRKIKLCKEKHSSDSSYFAEEESYSYNTQLLDKFKHAISKQHEEIQSILLHNKNSVASLRMYNSEREEDIPLSKSYFQDLSLKNYEKEFSSPSTPFIQVFYDPEAFLPPREESVLINQEVLSMFVQNSPQVSIEADDEPTTDIVYEDSLEIDTSYLNTHNAVEDTTQLEFDPKFESLDDSEDILGQCKQVLREILKNNSQTFAELVNTPFVPDPPEKRWNLGMTSSEQPNPIIDKSIFNILLQVFKSKGNSNLESFLRMVVDAFNEALNYSRPHGTDGHPLPWSRTNQKLHTPKTLDHAIHNSEQLVNLWNSFKAGVTDEQDYYDVINKMIYYDVLAHDDQWVDYQHEELEVTNELGSLIFQDIIEETISIL